MGCSRAAISALAILLLLIVPGSSWGRGHRIWTTLSDHRSSVPAIDSEAGMLRAPDGVLHVVWFKQQGLDGSEGYGTSTISPRGKLVSTGSALSGWDFVGNDPQLVPDGSKLRLIFAGGTGSHGCRADGGVFTATSAGRSSWKLGHGSLSYATTTGVDGIAATTEPDGRTPVVTFEGGHLFHIGVDPRCPSRGPDGTIAPSPSSSQQSDPAIVTDPRSGSVWVGWLQSDSFGAVSDWVERILPTQGSPLEAPSSASGAFGYQGPQVALAARRGGGVYMAYCISSGKSCAHIGLWKVGSSRPLRAPGSGGPMALAAAPEGRLALAWSSGRSIHAVATNRAATAFGHVRTVKAPPSNEGSVNDVQAQPISGRLDLIVNTDLDLFHTQIQLGGSS